MKVNNIKGNKRIWKRVGISLLVIFTVIMLLLLIAPPIMLYHVVNNRVEYAGNTYKNPLQDIYKPEDFGLDAREIILTTEDGFQIWSSEVFIENPKAVIIYLSGIQQPSVTYFYGHSRWMKNEGYASILLEVRGHGSSEGERICFGYEEVADVKAVVDYIKMQEKYKDVPIVLHGVSMGGAVAINSFGMIKEIDGLIAMSAYSSLEDVVYDMMRSMYIPRVICSIEKSIINKTAKLIFGNKVDQIKPIIQIKNVGERPALLIASMGDTEVRPINMKRLLDNGSDNIEHWLRDSYEHFIINEKDFANMEKDQEYCDRILVFLEGIINTKTDGSN